MSSEVAAAIFAAALAFLFSVISKYLHEKNEEDALVSALRSDILTTVDILNELKIVDGFIGVFENPSEYKKFSWVDAPRDEDYFSVFNSLLPKIGLLPGRLPGKTINFYNYLKASRDAAKPFSRTLPGISEQEIRESARCVLLSIKKSIDAAEYILLYEDNCSFFHNKIIGVESSALSEIRAKLAGLNLS